VAHANALAQEIPNATLLRLEHAGHELAAADTDTVLTALLSQCRGE
jgi:hypothetical protein